MSLNLVIKLVKRDFHTRFSGTTMGGLLAVAPMLLQVLVLYVGIRYGVHNKSALDQSYVPWLIAGIIFWLYLADLITQTSNSISSNSSILRKLKVRLLTLVISKFTYSSLLYLPLVAVASSFFYQNRFGISFVFFVTLIVHAFLCYVSIGIILSIFSLIFKDIGSLIGPLVTTLFWLSGVIWNTNSLDQDVLAWLYLINPVAFDLEVFRIFLGVSKNNLTYLNFSAGMSNCGLLVLLAWSVTRKYSRHIGDLI